MVLNDDSYFKAINKIDKYLIKKNLGESYFSVFLEGYNNNYIYIKLVYDAKIKAYKIVWFDLNYINYKKLDSFINIQVMTSYLANRVVDKLMHFDLASKEYLNDDYLGDRVVVKNYMNDKTYVFDRYIPEELRGLVDPIVILFSYLPRSMEVFLNEIFGEYDGVADKYNASKPIRFDLNKGNIEKLFTKRDYENGLKLFKEEKVTFLEKINDKYLAILDGKNPFLIIIQEITKDFVLLWCSCPNILFCEHLCAVLLAIQEQKYNAFYKVRYKGLQKSLLERVKDASFYFCFGVDGDNLLLVSDQVGIIKAPIYENGKCMFEVIEDDDECSLSKILNVQQKK